MVLNVSGRNFPEAYHEVLWKLRICGAVEQSRNGPVITIQEPFVLTIHYPWERVVSCPVRDANPFFHVMEVVWMFAGQKNVAWLKQFNKRIEEYANNGLIHGAYGHRWLVQWGDQIGGTIDRLRRDPNTRQAVISMWDPDTDNASFWKDRPCNTHIYFRTISGELDMTICNRSNDVIWGMFGANCVHMSYLHELVAVSAGLQVGKYHVMTNNLHFYPGLYPNGDAIWANLTPHSLYGSVKPMKFVEDKYAHEKLKHDCYNFICGFHDKLQLPWMKGVAKPMYDAYLAKTHGARVAHAQLIEDEAWQAAALAWLGRRSAV